MRALTLTAHGDIEQLRVQDIPPPRLAAADEVLIRVRMAALNHLDLFVVRGLPGVRLSFPHIVAADAAGEVEAAGPEVREFHPGDRVMVNPGLSCYQCDLCREGEHSLCPSYRLLGEHVGGTAAEYIAIPERNLSRIPDAMPWEKAAAFSLSALTAWRMLANRAGLRAGETVLIWGIGGGVALAALQVAQLCGARTIVTSSSDAKLEAARALGADVTLNYVTQDVAAEVRRLTEKRGVEVVVDNVGEATWERSLRCLARRGRLVTCGSTTGPMVVTDARKLFWYQWSILGSTMGSHEEYQHVCRLGASGRLWPVVDRIYPMAEGVDAFRRLESGEQFGKIVIEVPS